MSTCHICREDRVEVLLDCGPQPVSNRFLSRLGDDEYTHLMTVGQCQACGLIQMVDPVPAGELLPLYEWITYNEPEGHLDQVADMLVALPGLTNESTFYGISFKDDTTLQRIRERGFERTRRIDPMKDLGITVRHAGVETVQDSLTSKAADSIVHQQGQADVVVVRHILEHAHQPLSFMEAVRRLVKPTGYLIFEAPDCTLALNKLDYSSIWEEHVVYFIPDSFQNCFAQAGFSMERFDIYPYPFENCLVAVVRPFGAKGLAASPNLEEGLNRGTAFGKSLVPLKQRYQEFFSGYRREQGKIALFGAGHLACSFVNLLDLAEHIEFIADDNPHKRGLLMPGSQLPIHGSLALVEQDIKLCFLSLSPEAEDKVIQNNQEFIQQGGTFSSIFPASKLAMGI